MSNAKLPTRADGDAATSGSCGPTRPGCGKMYPTTWSWPGSSGYPAATHISQASRRKSTSAASWTASERGVGMRRASTRERRPRRGCAGWPRLVRAPRRQRSASRSTPRRPTRATGGCPSRRRASAAPRRRAYRASQALGSPSCRPSPNLANPGCASSGCGSGRCRQALQRHHRRLRGDGRPRDGLAGRPPPPAGRGVARTGVTAIVPADPATLFRHPVPAGVAVLNGAGELTGRWRSASGACSRRPST